MKEISFRLLNIVLAGFIAFSASCQPKNTAEFTLIDFYKDSPLLDEKVNTVFNSLSLSDRAAQMIITAAGRYGKPHDEVKKLTDEGIIGGVLLLNGTKEGFTKLVEELNAITIKKNKPSLIFSADAEPSLINRKIQGTPEIKKTSEITDIDDCKRVAGKISNELLNIGIHQNYAPVIDISPNNEAIGNRSFGNEPLQVINMAMTFMEESQKMNIVNTIKHFPGHGNVMGDTHKKLVYIDGEMTEIENYVPFIDNGAISIMVAHLAIENNETYNTNGLPSSCSPSIVSKLLRQEMGFDGIIITDAMNMGALNDFDNSPLLAAKAGCDLVLMPNDERKLHKDLIKLLSEKTAMRTQLENSIKRVLRLKACLGLI